MPLRDSIKDREFDKFGTKDSGQTATHVIATIDNSELNPLPVTSGLIKSWTREVVTVSTTPVALNPDTDQVYIRIVPLVNGNFYYGPDNGISSAGAEVFSKAAPVEITIDNIVYIVKESGSGDVVVYRGRSV